MTAPTEQQMLEMHTHFTALALRMRGAAVEAFLAAGGLTLEEAALEIAGQAIYKALLLFNMLPEELRAQWADMPLITVPEPPFEEPQFEQQMALDETEPDA